MGEGKVEAINHALAQPLEGFYIWRTVEDAKVRGTHARHNRTLRAWKDAPDPGEDFNCRCWAEHVDKDTVEYPDAIEPAIGPFDILLGGAVVKSAGSAAVGAAGTVGRVLFSQRRDVSWIRNTPRSQLQSKFKHAKVFGIKGNSNNKNLEAYKKALEEHIKSPDTHIIKGTYHTKQATHYYNSRTNINIIRDAENEFQSVWELSKAQIQRLLKDGKLAGSK